MREITVNPSAFVRAPLPAWFRQQRQLPETSLHEPAVMRLADSHFRVDAQASVVVHRAIQVNDASALPEVGQSPISFQPDYQRIELHWLKVYRNGQVIDKLDGTSVRFYHSERSAEQGIYTGLITAVVITQDVRPGDTVEIIYSLVGRNPVFGGRYAEAASWDSSIPVLKRRVTLDLPKGRLIDHRVIGTSGKAPPPMTTTEIGERHLVRYEELPPESLNAATQRLGNTFLTLVQELNNQRSKIVNQFTARVKEIDLATVLAPVTLMSREGIEDGRQKLSLYEAEFSKSQRELNRLNDELIAELHKLTGPPAALDQLIRTAEDSIAASYERSLRAEENQRRMLAIMGQFLSFADERFGQFRLQDGQLIFTSGADLRRYESLRQQLEAEAKTEAEIAQEQSGAREKSIKKL